MKRIGIFGGAFDPVHNGHLGVAAQCRAEAKLDEVWFVPSAHHPWKADTQAASFEDRVAMLRLALAQTDGLRVEEIERSLPSPTYTANTLDALRCAHPDVEWFFLIGSDALAEFALWHEPQRIVAGATLLGMARPGHAILSADKLRTELKLDPAQPLRLQVVNVSPSEVSSSEVRRRVAVGETFAELVSENVERYIAEHGLYQTTKMKDKILTPDS